jgi:sugar/nucleoside kinase (ribokinase family)
MQMNEAEAAVLGELSEPSEAALSSLAVSLLGLGPQLVVITRGAAGALAVAADGTRCTLHATAVCGAAEAVDTTGCGDVFLAALGLGVIRGELPQRVLESACRAAGLASRVRGPKALHVLSQLRPV